MALLTVEHLNINIETEEQTLAAVRDVSFSVEPGEILALIGESGSGKTLTALSLLNLLDPPVAIRSGNISFGNDNVLSFSESALENFRGKKAAMIFQEPMTALNPVFTIGFQIREVLSRHEGLKGKEADARAAELLKSVGIGDPEIRLRQYPFQLSGGLRQRAMIAMAIATNPELLIADEPTTALDVTIQAQILALLQTLNTERNMAILIITHDFGVVAQLAHRVAVMYGGQIVESGSIRNILKQPGHPYTEALLKAIPAPAREGSRAPRDAEGNGSSGRNGMESGGDRRNNEEAIETGLHHRERLYAIPGNAPSLAEIGSGCAFAPRCSRVTPECREENPQLQTLGEVQARCIHPLEH